jgi:hypothetical protein
MFPGVALLLTPVYPLRHVEAVLEKCAFHVLLPIIPLDINESFVSVYSFPRRSMPLTIVIFISDVLLYIFIKSDDYIKSNILIQPFSQ